MNASMISVSDELLESLDQIMHSGVRGVHLLFSNSMIRDAYDGRSPMDDLLQTDLTDKLQDSINEVLMIDDLSERQDFIENLDSALRSLLIQVYFGFLDRYVTSDTSQEIFH